MADRRMNEARYRLLQANADLAYSLEVFGDELAKRERYKDLDGFDAIHFYLVQKHHWLLRDVRAMSHEDLRFVLSQELANWRIPAHAGAVFDQPPKPSPGPG